MEAVVLCGIQASGKTTFYVEHYLHTHVRISLDLLRTRQRELAFVEACLRTRARFVVDNTNPTAAERARYVVPARNAGYRVVACFFDVEPRVALSRNAEREGRARIPVPGILGTRKRLEPPRREEGFDALLVVRDGSVVEAEDPRAG